MSLTQELFTQPKFYLQNIFTVEPAKLYFLQFPNTTRCYNRAFVCSLYMARTFAESAVGCSPQ